MTQTNAAATTTPTTPTTPTSAVNNTKGAQLGKDAFLKLLVAQLQHQDPGNPMDSSAFMGQLAQFSSLEQMTNVATAVDKLTASNSVTQSVGLLGHELVFARADGSAGHGIADGVALLNGNVTIDVAGESVALADITAVGPAASPTSTTTPTA
ncbi:MAG: flagellar hook capping protein [Actinomycetia bacterium]|jgi:flagellar basal-body rod modification protein FlgD|nr:flagellar hook capping protein [Actinomycetes bacterium]